MTTITIHLPDGKDEHISSTVGSRTEPQPEQSEWTLLDHFGTPHGMTRIMVPKTIDTNQCNAIRDYLHDLAKDIAPNTYPATHTNIGRFVTPYCDVHIYVDSAVATRSDIVHAVRRLFTKMPTEVGVLVEEKLPR